MKEKIKELFLYDGLTKENYNSIKGDIWEQNRKNIIAYSIIMIVIFGFLYLVSHYVEDLSPNGMAYLGTMIFSFVLFFLSVFFSKKNLWVNALVTYLFLGMMGIYTIIVGTINEPSEPAVGFNIALILIPFWTYDYLLRSLIFRILLCAVYFVLVFKYKDPGVVWTDVIDAVAYGTLSVVIGAINQQTKSSAYHLKRNMQKEIAEKTEQIQKLTLQTVSAFAGAIDAKDKYTNGHSSRVAQYSKMIAQRSGMSEEEVNKIYYIALLHDIGKIGVPDSIINKPDRLSDEEYAIIKEHPLIGNSILKPIDAIPEISSGALNHHERYDGNGYPNRIEGEEIPVVARIIAVADSYDAMTSNRSYRKYMPQDKVRAEIEGGIGTQFDPVYASVMLDIIKEDVDYKLHE